MHPPLAGYVPPWWPRVSCGKYRTILKKAEVYKWCTVLCCIWVIRQVEEAVCVLRDNYSITASSHCVCIVNACPFFVYMVCKTFRCIQLSCMVCGCAWIGLYMCAMESFSHVQPGQIISWRDGLNQIFGQWPGFLWPFYYFHCFVRTQLPQIISFTTYLLSVFSAKEKHSVSCNIMVIIYKNTQNNVLSAFN